MLGVRYQARFRRAILTILVSGTLACSAPGGPGGPPTAQPRASARPAGQRSGAPADRSTHAYAFHSPASDERADPQLKGSPWTRLTRSQAIFTSDWAKLPCVTPRIPFLLVLDAADPARPHLAADAGCEVLTETGPDELGLCCPSLPGAANPRRTGGLDSCEQARERYLETYDSQVCEAPPTTSSEKHGDVLNDGTYLRGCSVPARSSIAICAAIVHGKALGVTVRTTPASVRLGDCIALAVRALEFPNRSQMDITRTTFPARVRRPDALQPSFR